MSKTDRHLQFETFELSPLNAVVMSARGRVIRVFPASARSVPLATTTRRDFQVAIAQTLALMSHQCVAGLQPRVRKASEMVDEDRDTTHPGMINEFFEGFLAAVGSHVEVSSLSKNTREDVHWDNAKSPWRRSPLWLLLIVSLQLKCQRLGGSYAGLRTNLIYAMNAKLSRRTARSGTEFYRRMT